MGWCYGAPFLHLRNFNQETEGDTKDIKSSLDNINTCLNKRSQRNKQRYSYTNISTVYYHRILYGV